METSVTYGPWIQTGAIVASFIGVILTILATQRVAKRRATLDLMMMEQTNEGMIERRRTFVRLKEAGNLVEWASREKKSSEDSTTIRAVLNQHELIAIGIKEGTLDEKIYKKWYRTTVVNDWISCKPFVMQLRSDLGSGVFWKEYELLVRSWAQEGERGRI